VGLGRLPREAEAVHGGRSSDDAEIRELLVERGLVEENLVCPCLPRRAAVAECRLENIGGRYQDAVSRLSRDYAVHGARLGGLRRRSGPQRRWQRERSARPYWHML
jgi:hypothetical protein